jgi:hypothetical protein
MKSLGLIAVLAATLMAAPATRAQQAPAGSTGQCRDGSYTSQAHKRGACRGHKGVQTWYADADAPAAVTTADATATAAPAATAKPPKSGRSMDWTKPAAKAAPGGGPGLVWVNGGSKVYHCQDDKWYGRTRHGKYLPEADAKAKGYHGPRGKGCTA